MNIWFQGKEIKILPYHCQCMADCLLQWQNGEVDPDEEDNAKDLRNDLMADFTKLAENADE